MSDEKPMKKARIARTVEKDVCYKEVVENGWKTIKKIFYDEDGVEDIKINKINDDYISFKHIFHMGLLYMKCKAYKTNVNALLDLGANANLLNYELYKRLSHKPHLHPAD